MLQRQLRAEPEVTQEENEQVLVMVLNEVETSGTWSTTSTFTTRKPTTFQTQVSFCGPGGSQQSDTKFQISSNNSGLVCAESGMWLVSFHRHTRGDGISSLIAKRPECAVLIVRVDWVPVFISHVTTKFVTHGQYDATFKPQDIIVVWPSKFYRSLTSPIVVSRVKTSATFETHSHNRLLTVVIV